MSDETRYCNCYDPWNCREPLPNKPCRPWTQRERENAERADALQSRLEAAQKSAREYAEQAGREVGKRASLKQRIKELENGLSEIRKLINLRYPNGAPDDLRDIFGIAADTMRKSDEIASGRSLS